MDRLVKRAFVNIVRRGTLEVRLPSGNSFTVGDGTGEPIAVAFKTRVALLACLIDPELRLGEAFMNGTFVIERGSIASFLDLVMSQDYAIPPLPGALLLAGIRYILRRISQFNPRIRARRNIHHHYDLDGRLYSIFLDSDRQYSCAYFERPEMSLDDAQLAKRRHLAAKLLLDKPGLKVLDIGSGWGGLAIYLAETCGAQVLGCTLSDEQYVVSRQRAQERGLKDMINFELEDYRDLEGRFDRIVSVGMFEHVGVVHYDAFFRKIKELLTEDGVAVVHSIGRSGQPTATSAWIKKYIFPGGYIPALSEVFPAIQRQHLVVTDIEILRLHYAETSQGMARPLPRPPRGSHAALRRTFLSHVGILLGRFGNGVSPPRVNGVPGSARAPAGHCAAHARLPVCRRGASARGGAQRASAGSSRRRVTSGPQSSRRVVSP